MSTTNLPSPPSPPCPPTAPGPFWRSRLLGSLLVGGLGVAMLGTRFGESWARLSYDSLYWFTSKSAPSEIVFVRLDELAHRELHQSRTAWDRGLHARLLDQLRRDEAKLAVFDVFLTEERGEPATNAILAAAIAANGRVVLAGDQQPINTPQFKGALSVAPLEPFRRAAAAWGLDNFERDRDRIVRRHFAGTDLDPSLAWAAAAFLQAPSTRRTERNAFFQRTRWLRYYPPSNTSLSYHLALEQEPGYFRDKIVFIGGQPRTRFGGEEADEFLTPLPSEGGGATFVAGVDIHAAAFLNLMHGDWLDRPSRFVESLLLLALGALSTLGVSALRLRWIVPVAVAGIVVIGIASLWVALHLGWWFGWLLVIGLQLPAAAVWAGAAGWQPRRADVFRPSPSESPPPKPHASDDIPTEPAMPISGHTMIRCIGRGAYGEVWLARDILGNFHAVKVIYRRNFDSDAPYDREFRGIQKFTPISRNHPGFVHVLHVDRDDKVGAFYYVMEAGDDVTSGQKLDAATYVPKNLARELTRRGSLPVEECLALFVALASALEHLHRHRLIHRDIKPSNIIFVNGSPKLADIGLVTDISRQSRDVTYIGTEGYLAPEGPGTPAADVYSLGKVIYETAMGISRDQFPALPPELLEKPAEDPLFALNDIILRACAHDVKDRYPTAAALREELVQLQERLKQGPTVQPENSV